MISFRRDLAIVTLILMALAASPAIACTSFMLETDDGLYFAHSLNMGSWDSVPGQVYFNPRGLQKRGYTWESLISISPTVEPSLEWQSKYGSVTFNPLGRGCPDGGINEAGLFIWEMGLDQTAYPSDTSRPTLFQMQWMQYQLDNYASVDEVLDHVRELNLDGWGWHYFVADRTGAVAIIDFIDSHPVVYTGNALPIPLCCNSIYADAIDSLRTCRGFGGETEIVQQFEEIPRFIYGAKLLKEYAGEEPVDYCLTMLDEMSVNVRWSVVVDVSRSTVYFRTNVNRETRSFSYDTDDFASSQGPLMMDLASGTSGDVRSKFAAFTEDANRAAVESILARFCEYPAFRKQILEDQDATLSDVATAIFRRMSVEP